MTKNGPKTPVRLAWSMLVHERLAQVGILFRKYSSSSDLWHSHEGYYELVLAFSGTAVNETESGRFSIRSGDLCVMAPGSVHHYVAMNQFQHYAILIQSDIFSRFPGDLAKLPHFRDLFPEGQSCSPLLHVEGKILQGILEIVENACDEYRNRKSGWLEAFYAEFFRALIAILRHVQSSKQKSDQAAYQISNAVRFMSENLREEHTLESLSGIAQMSVSNFRFQFKMIMGTSPVDYLICLRLKQAVMLMEYTDLRISEIMLRAGFKDSSYFTRKFHAVFGRTPREFRKGIQTGEILPSEELSRLMPVLLKTN